RDAARSERMGGHRHVQTLAEVICPSNMIRMMMSQKYLPYSATFGHQAIDKAIQFLLLFFIRRRGIDNNHLLAADQVAVRVRSRRQCRSLDRKEEDSGSGLDAPDYAALRLGNCNQSASALLQTGWRSRESSDYVQRRRRQDDRLSHPAFEGVGRSDPFTVDQFTGLYGWLLTLGEPCQKEPGVKAAGCKWRRHPSACGDHGIGVDLKSVLFEDAVE